MATDSSIVIVTWNSDDEIGNCLNSIFLENDPAPEIIIVDNASADRTKEILSGYGSKIKVILNNDNIGYTFACNQGIEASSGKYVLLLNPDTMIAGDAIQELASYLDKNPGAGAIAPQLLNEDLSIQHSVRTLPGYWDMFCEMSLLSAIFPKSRVFSRWKMRYFDHNTEQEVEQPMAAALMVRKDLLDKVGKMDGRYSMFFNDVDLCKKLLDSGNKIVFYPEAKIVHSKGKSIYKDRARMIRVWTDDCLKYFSKHHYNVILYPLFYLSLKFTSFFRVLFAKSKS
ncbi:MAG TPA: glycosyltransferase family 2 protein [Ignavibacteria bacterium]|nr:glycosyltransferase family 2 protein [Ignavibacteria bacterium]